MLATSFSERELDDARRRTELLGLDGVEFEVLDLREIEQRRPELGSFDQIICLETIEHLSDDQGLLVSLAGLLRPGGRLLLSTPYDGHRPLYSEERHPSPVEDGSHVRYGYSPERLHELALGAGLQPQQLGFVSGVVSQRLTNLMRRLTRRLGRHARVGADAAAAPAGAARPAADAAWRATPTCRWRWWPAAVGTD